MCVAPSTPVRPRTGRSRWSQGQTVTATSTGIIPVGITLGFTVPDEPGVHATGAIPVSGRTGVRCPRPVHPRCPHGAGSVTRRCVGQATFGTLGSTCCCLFERAQLLLAERSDSASAQAANASDCLLTGFLRCQRCGHGFVGTAAHGNGGVYRYYTCFSRQRHGTARCDQERLPAGPLEEAILAATLAALDDGSIFKAAALRAEQAWHAQHPGRQGELAGTRAALAERRASIERYLRAFETGRLPEPTCADRLTELEQEARALEARTAALEAECETTPVMATGEVLVGVRHRVECAPWPTLLPGCSSGC